MENTLLKIKILYDKMGGAERKIADYILAHPDHILSFSISELADACGCGEATVVRFSRRLGFGGYQQLKISIAKEENLSRVHEGIRPDDSVSDIYNKICNDIYCSLEKTKANLSPVDLERVCSLCLEADRILVFGLGNSASVAMDAAHKLARLGLYATACTDNHMQAILASHVTNDTLVLGISHSGSSKDIVEALRLAKARGAHTASITNYGKSPITKVSDVVLNTVSDETNYSILGLSSRISQLSMMDAVYSYLVIHLDGAAGAISSTEEALLDKKY